MPESDAHSVTQHVTQRAPRSRTRKILYALAGLLTVVGIGAVILLTAFPNTLIRYVVEPKLKQLVVDRLGQRYALEMKSMKLSKGKDSLILIGVRIVDNGRTAKGSTDSSAKNFGEETPLDRLTTDTVMISGLEYWKLIFQRGLFANTISIRSPKIYLRPGALPKFEKNTKLLPGFLPAVSSKVVKVENAEVYFSEEQSPSSVAERGVRVKNASLEFRDFYLDESTYKNANSTFFCKGANFRAEDISQVDSLGATVIRVDAVDGDLIDSSMTVHSIETTALIDEVRRVAIEEIQFSGLDWFGALAGRGLHGRRVAILKPEIYLEDVARISPHSSLRATASDLIPLPSLLPNVSVEEVEVANAELYALLPQSKSRSALKHIGLSLSKFKIDSATPFTQVSAFFSEHARYGISEESTLSTALGTVHIGGIRGTEKAVAVSNVRLDPTLKGLKLVRVKSAEITGVDIWKLLMRQGLFASKVNVDHPALYLDKSITQPITSLDSILGSDPLAMVRDMKQFPLPMLLPVAHVGTVTVSGGAVHGIHFLDDPKNPPAPGDSLSGLKIALKNFSLDKKTWVRKRGMLFSDAAEFSVGAMKQHTPGATYSYSESGIRGDLRKRTLTIDSVRMLPLISEDSFGVVFPFRTERLDFFAPRVTVTGVDYQKLLTGTGIYADNVDVNGWRIHVYGDRRKPERERTVRDQYPHELFQQMRMLVGIKHVAIRDGNIRFRESWPDTSTPGTITLDHFNARVGRISNDRRFVGDTTATTIDGDLMIMDSGLVRFTIGYDLLSPKLNMDVRGSVGGMDASIFNDFLSQTEPFTLTGTVQSAEFRFALRDSMMTGNLAPQYDNLHVKFFRWDRFPPGFVSFFANALYMRTHNIADRDNPLKTADISALIDPKVNIFWSLWKPIRDAIGDVIRIPDWVW